MPDPLHVAAAPLHSHPGCDLQCGAGASQAEQVVCKLNRRFCKGAPAVTFARAGVLVHVFDTNLAGWCAEAGCLLSRAASVSVAADYNWNQLQLGAPEGVVLSPKHVDVSCLWAMDGGTGARWCKDNNSACLSGCGDPPNWCDRGSLANENFGDYCPWRPTELELMLMQHERLHRLFSKTLTKSYHNEVVISPPAIAAVQAVFYTGDTPSDIIRWVHRELVADTPGHLPPLLHLDLSNRTTPFTLAHHA